MSSSPDGAGRDASASRPDSPGRRQRFPRACRLKARREFLRVYAEGRRLSTPLFTVFYRPSEAGRSRVGLTVTRRIGGAVCRNRVKRVLRDAYRRNRQLLTCEVELVVNAHRSIREATTAAVEQELCGCLRRIDRRTREGRS